MYHSEIEVSIDSKRLDWSARCGIHLTGSILKKYFLISSSLADGENDRAGDPASSQHIANVSH